MTVWDSKDPAPNGFKLPVWTFEIHNRFEDNMGDSE